MFSFSGFIVVQREITTQIVMMMVQVAPLNVSLIDPSAVRTGETGAETRRRRRTGTGGEQGDLSGVSSGSYYYVTEVYL